MILGSNKNLFKTLRKLSCAGLIFVGLVSFFNASFAEDANVNTVTPAVGIADTAAASVPTTSTPDAQAATTTISQSGPSDVLAVTTTPNSPAVAAPNTSGVPNVNGTANASSTSTSTVTASNSSNPTNTATFSSSQSQANPTATTAASSPSSAPDNTPPAPALPSSSTKPTYCPDITELRKDGMIWTARGIWTSYSQSFASGISGFIGAQWLGIKLGKIVCLYRGKDAFDFPVALETEKTMLVLLPQDPNWKTDQSGYKVCKSGSVYDCPFFVKPEEDVSDVYEQIEYQGKPGEPVDNDDELLN